MENKQIDTVVVIETKPIETISIIALVDVIGTLAEDSLKGNIYLFDNNRLNGSVGEGTDNLMTKLKFDSNAEINLVWNIASIEPESFACISQVVVNKEYIKVEKKNYNNSDIIYWKGSVKKNFDKLSYQLFIKVGTRNFEYPCQLTLIGNQSVVL